MVYQFNLSYRQIKRNVIQRVSPLCCRRESVFPMRIFLKGAVNGTNRTHSTFIGVRTPPCNHHAHKGTFSKELVKAAPRRLEDSDNVLRPPDVCSLCIHACACEEFFFLPPSSLRLDSKFVLSTSTAPHSAFFAFPRGLCAPRARKARTVSASLAALSEVQAGAGRNEETGVAKEGRAPLSTSGRGAS